MPTMPHMRWLLQTVELMVRIPVFHVADRNIGMANRYAEAGVDTAAGDRAVELMKAAVSRTLGPNSVGGFGGFAGLFDASLLKSFEHPLLATSTDGVGTKIAIAQALDKHDTIGQDLVGMVVDDIVVVGARPLFMTDYIACGKVVPERIAAIVAGIAAACEATGTALVGGETAEHPDLMKPDDYDLAGAAVGVVEADAALGPDKVRHGDIVIALASSGLHSNGFSLVRKILRNAKVEFTADVEDLGSVGESLLEPTRLYTTPLLGVLEDLPGEIHALSHVTGGGIAANLARVLPVGSWVEVDRGTWSPAPVFRVLADLGAMDLTEAEGTWNLGIGMIAVVNQSAASGVIHALGARGIPSWVVGRVTIGARVSTGSTTGDGWETGAKGVNGGAVRLIGSYRS